jgi:hypothetical protein
MEGPSLAQIANKVTIDETVRMVPRKLKQLIKSTPFRAMPSKKGGLVKNRPPTPRQDAVLKNYVDTNHDEMEDESNSEESVKTTEMEVTDKRD